MVNIALIAAAGKGCRMNAGLSKMLMRLDEKPILTHTLEKFEEAQCIDKIVLVINPTDRKVIEQIILSNNRFNKVTKIITGGNTRQDSVYNGLQAIDNDQEDIVLIHDGARPFITEQMMKATIQQAQIFDGAIIAVPVLDTIKKVQSEQLIDRTIDRGRLWQAQTPQTFRLSCIKALHRKASKEGFVASDDAIIVEHYGGQVKIIEGSRNNLKITDPFDMAVAKVLMRKGLW